VSDIVDWVLAEWIASRVAGIGSAGADQSGVTGVDLGELAVDAETRVVSYTGLIPTGALPTPEGVSRTEWVRANLSSMRKLMEPMLAKAGGGLGPLKPTAQLAIGFTVSGEVGLLVGYMSLRVLGQYELVLLEEIDAPAPRLLFVLPNLAKAVTNFKADQREFLTWVTLHEVTHAVQFSSVPWLQGHLSGLIREIMASAEVRLDTKRRFRLPSRKELRRVGTALRHGDMIGVVTNAAERETLDRVQAVMAVIEGHAEHVMDAVAPELLPSLPRLRQSLDERRSNQSRLGRLVGRLLGLELKMRQYERGKIFCDAIVAAAGPSALTQVFSAPEALPSLAEIEDPPAWLERMGLSAPELRA
jgi:coenzyme F420 biosynthesis associated uncharacterized protein